MRGIILVLFVLFITGISHATAYAATEVQCVEGDCLRNGWWTHDQITGQTLEVFCFNDDCAENGWEVVSGRGQLQNTIDCYGEGCFSSGWMQYDAVGRPVFEVRCAPARENQSRETEMSCLNKGWITDNLRGWQAITRCIADDCKKRGWRTRYPDGRREEVRCFKGGCFTSGWALRP